MRDLNPFLLDPVIVYSRGIRLEVVHAFKTINGIELGVNLPGGKYTSVNLKDVRLANRHNRLYQTDIKKLNKLLQKSTKVLTEFTDILNKGEL